MKIRRWEPGGCECKLCKDFVSNVGYVNLVWLRGTGLTVRISAKKCLLCRYLPALYRNVETAAECEIGTGLTIMTGLTE